FAGAAALKGALSELIVHERTDVETNLGPQRLVIRLEHDPFRPPEQALFDEQSHSANREVFPFARKSIGADERARSPDHIAVHREIAQAVDAQRIETAILRIRQADGEFAHGG